MFKDPYISLSTEAFYDNNNCTVVSWSVVFNCSYEKANKYLMSHGRKAGKGMYSKDIDSAFSGVKKAKWKKGPYSRTNRITLGKFCKKHPEGRFYVIVRGHALAVIDGVIHDHSHKPRRQVVTAYRVYLEGEY